VKSILSRTILIRGAGTKVDVLLFYPINQPSDFDEADAWVNATWPITDGVADV